MKSKLHILKRKKCVLFMFKKIILSGISALMVFGLGACGNSEVVSEGDTSTGSSLDNKDVTASMIHS